MNLLRHIVVLFPDFHSESHRIGTALQNDSGGVWAVAVPFKADVASSTDAGSNLALLLAVFIDTLLLRVH